MTIYEKLSEARVRFQDSNIKMTGENSFAKYKYFELSDILPVINRLGKELGFICLVSFSDDLASLTVKDTLGDGEIVFTTPMSTANLKGCHEVQNLGAVETYLKRYLYQNAFEIVEADALNGTQNPNEKLEHKKEPVYNTAKDQCTKLSSELNLDDAWKKKLWNDSGKNWSNLLITLKSMKEDRDLDSAADAVFSGPENVQNVFGGKE